MIFFATLLLSFLILGAFTGVFITSTPKNYENLF